MVDAAVAEVASDLESLIPLFMQTRQDNLAGLEAGLQAGDFRALEVIGHSMKGAGGAYGFPPVSTIGALIETAAKGRDTESVSALAVRLREYLANVQIRYI